MFECFGVFMCNLYKNTKAVIMQGLKRKQEYKVLKYILYEDIYYVVIYHTIIPILSQCEIIYLHTVLGSYRAR